MHTHHGNYSVGYKHHQLKQCQPPYQPLRIVTTSALEFVIDSTDAYL